MDANEEGFAAEVRRLSSDATKFAVRYRCPWCGDSTNLPTAHAVALQKSKAAMIVVCQTRGCHNPSLVVVEFTYAQSLRTHERLEVIEVKSIQPSRRVNYAPAGVPPEIAEDFQEALRCRAAGFLYGAAVVGRRALEAALRGHGAKAYMLADQINEMSDETLPKNLKLAAHHVRLIGNDAAHGAHARTVTELELASLVGFVTDVLHQLYVLPHNIAQQKRQIEAKDLPGAARARAEEKANAKASASAAKAALHAANKAKATPKV